MCSSDRLNTSGKSLCGKIWLRSVRSCSWCPGWCQVPARASASPEVHLLFISSWEDQATFLQALLTYNWICSMVFPKSIVLSLPLVIFHWFNSWLNDRHRLEGAVLLGPACAGPSCAAALSDPPALPPAHRHDCPETHRPHLVSLSAAAACYWGGKAAYCFFCLTFLDAVVISINYYMTTILLCIKR